MRIIISEGKINDVVKKWLTDNYGNLERYETNKFPNHIFYVKDGEVIFDYNRKNGYCNISNEEIWSFLERVFQLELAVIWETVKEWVGEHYKLRVTTTFVPSFHSLNRWGTLQIKGNDNHYFLR